MNIGWSNFALGRHAPNKGYSYFKGTNEELLNLVRDNWDLRKPGSGRTDLDKVVVVPVPPRNFVGTTVTLTENLALSAEVTRRQPHEDPFVKVKAVGRIVGSEMCGRDEETGLLLQKPLINHNVTTDPVRFANVVMYSAEALLENDGERSGDFDWEVVAIIASAVENEPMHPLAMVRNYLGKPGGTPMPLTLEMLAESVWYWSTRVSVG